MANAHEKGTAHFKYVVGGSTSTVKLVVPLKHVRPGHRVARFVRDSLDFSTREVFTVSDGTSTGVAEITADIRFANDRQEILDMLKQGSFGTTLIYYSSSGATGINTYLIEPQQPEVSIDPVMARVERGSVSIRLRASTSGGSFSAIL